MEQFRRLANLAHKYAPVALLYLELANAVIELVSKVVNYGGKVREFLIQVHEKGETGLRA